MATRLIAGGAWCKVVINGQTVGLASGASYDEDWNVQPANVLNYHGPVDYDSQGYSCRISLQSFVPEPGVAGPWPDGGSIALHDLLPTRAEVQSNAGKPGMFDTLQFISTSAQKVLCQFEKVMVASNGTQISPNSYVTENISLLAVQRVRPAA